MFLGTPPTATRLLSEQFVSESHDKLKEKNWRAYDSLKYPEAIVASFPPDKVCIAVYFFVVVYKRVLDFWSLVTCASTPQHACLMLVRLNHDTVDVLLSFCLSFFSLVLAWLTLRPTDAKTARCRQTESRSCRRWRLSADTPTTRREYWTCSSARKRTSVGE